MVIEEVRDSPGLADELAGDLKHAEEKISRLQEDEEAVDYLRLAIGRKDYTRLIIAYESVMARNVTYEDHKALLDSAQALIYECEEKERLKRSVRSALASKSFPSLKDAMGIALDFGLTKADIGIALISPSLI